MMQAIPTKFTNNLRDKLTGTIALRGPSGSIWDVGLLANGETLLLKQGWTAFVKDHSLEEKDILVFKYNGNSRFDVLIFDHQNSCEREGSYFVKKCSHTESDCNSKRKISIEKSSEKTNNESSDDVEYHQAKKQRSIATRPTPSRRQPTRATSRGRRRTMSKCGYNLYYKLCSRISFKFHWIHFHVGGRRGSSSVPHMELESRRRAVTLEEKERAQRLAVAAAVEDNFIVVMRASHVYKGFFMVVSVLILELNRVIILCIMQSIPSEWLKKHHLDKSLAVELRVDEKKWVAKYHFKGYGGGLSGGWKKFVLANFLEEFDVCLFDLVSQKSDAIILDVKIFRVVQEVIPPSTIFLQPKSRGNGHATSESEDESE
ncbi:hypothetical protein RD792_005377 [Penstemon davidsonii]|uniref:TF-B3 domain-containing protein n=1 Tax=Penstemon davidsonii TaxID=160366 RepID=A0ABR0DK25_9LAMI|nr:hypothetical protein RD792_005377 [Penstemon davidsonii]